MNEPIEDDITEEDVKDAFREVIDLERKRRKEQKEAVELARPALDRLCEVMMGCSSQCYKVRALLYSIWNGQQTHLNELLAVDWEIKKDLCAVFLAFGFDDTEFNAEGAPIRNKDGDFYYDTMKDAITQVGRWEWFCEAHVDPDKS